MTDAARTRSKIVGSIILVVFLILYTIPLLAVALMANLAALFVLFSFFSISLADISV